MRKVLDTSSFDLWLKKFLPSLSEGDLALSPGRVADRSDGKLVHLDGVNFSRAWCLYHLTSYPICIQKADEHMTYSLGNIVDGDYAGEHWLASFALYAYKMREEAL